MLSVQEGSRDGSGAMHGGVPSPGGRPPFLGLAYGYMPLVWGATLAHYLPLLLTEVGLALPVRVVTFCARRVQQRDEQQRSGY